MKCPQCGFPCEDGGRFCPSCGFQLPAEEPSFESLGKLPQAMPTETLSQSEILKRQREEKAAKKFTALLVLSLFFSLILIAGAVYMVAFYPGQVAEKGDTASQTDIIEQSELIGSWLNGESYLVLTASGRFACDGVTGTYTSNDEAIVFTSSDNVYAEYMVSDGVLTLTRSRLGTETTYTFDFVTDKTDLSYSQLLALHEASQQ